MSTLVSQTRERFILAIVAQLPAERLIELHFFAPVRQGGIESGVAVIAASRETEAPPPELADVPAAEPDEPAGDAAENGAREMPRRYTVYTATYRLTLKGAERGKWEANVVAEADAPLVTVQTVVRGVQRRAGDEEPPERMSGDEVRSVIGATRAD
jgi:hypothetical protein